jgi:hypothetical protein
VNHATLWITPQSCQRSLNLCEGGTTNNQKARSDCFGPPDPPPSGALNGKTPQSAGFCFCGYALPRRLALSPVGRILQWAEEGLSQMTLRLILCALILLALGGCQNPSRIQAASSGSVAMD